MDIRVTYLCDGKKCERCYPECMHTSDYNHALHKDQIPDISKLFKYVGNGFIEEKKENNNGIKRET